MVIAAYVWVLLFNVLIIADIQMYAPYAPASFLSIRLAFTLLALPAL